MNDTLKSAISVQYFEPKTLQRFTVPLSLMVRSTDMVSMPC